MKYWINRIGSSFIPLLFVAAAALSGCAGNAPPALADAPLGQRGAQLWAENCTRCHNVRTPAMYSDAQWEVISMQMRVRANLTPVEYREILAFLKSAH